MATSIYPLGRACAALSQKVADLRAALWLHPKLWQSEALKGESLAPFTAESSAFDPRTAAKSSESFECPAAPKSRVLCESCAAFNESAPASKIASAKSASLAPNESAAPTQTPQQKPLKILHLASDTFAGGAESVFRDTIRLSAQVTHFEIYTASCDLGIPLSKKHIILDDWQRYSRLRGAFKYIFNLRNYRILRRELALLELDVIHAQNYLSRLSPSVLFALRHYKKRHPKTRLIYTQHGFGACANLCFYNYAKNALCEACLASSKLKIALYNCDRRGRIHSLLKALRVPFYQGVFLREQDLFDKIIFVSRFQAKKHLEDGYDPRKIAVITNPISLDFYNERINLAEKRDVIVFFGRLAREKNIELLLEAFANLTKDSRFLGYQLLIIGDGDRKSALKALAQRLFGAENVGESGGNFGLESRGESCDKSGVESRESCRESTPKTQRESVESGESKTRESRRPKDGFKVAFLGRKNPSELKAILSSAKISVLPSLWYETFGLSVVESILAAVVPLVNDIGALKETIGDFGGFAFRLNDKDDLVVLLKDSLNHYENLLPQLKNWQENALNAQQNYLESIVAAYEIDVYGGGGQPL